ncbi:MAG: ABC transporter ATP-binding protein [Alphaproteobacteria bacterium]
MTVVLALRGIARTFVQGNRRLEILRGCDLEVGRGEVVGLLGPSGSGKSTLLHVSGLLERPDGGEVEIAGQPCGRLADEARTRIRRVQLGFVYQFHYLMAEFTARENVMIPQMIAGLPRQVSRERADRLLGELGLSARADHRPAQLSGGEQQRVAIARAMANRPALILADEPTGNLDPGTAEQVFGSILDVVRNSGTAALIATHNGELAGRMDRTTRLEDGHLVPVA